MDIVTYALCKKLSNGSTFKIKGRVDSVSDLPADAQPGDFYFVGLEGADDFDEYVMKDDHTWEHIGTTQADMSAYVEKTELAETVAKINEELSRIGFMIDPNAESETILEETVFNLEIDWDSDEYNAVADLNIKEPSDYSEKYLYIIEIDNISYYAFLLRFYNDDDDFSYLGNLGVISEMYQDDNYPFVIKGARDNRNLKIYALMDFEGSHTIKISRHSIINNSILPDVIYKKYEGFVYSGPRHTRGVGYINVSGNLAKMYGTAEGYKTKATWMGSHAEGLSTEATGGCSHAEGNTTKASGASAHAQGQQTVASGRSSYAGGEYSIAKGRESFANGHGVLTSSKYQTAFGICNVDDAKYAFSIGNGEFDDWEEEAKTRSNALAIDWEGKLYVNNSTTGIDVSKLIIPTTEEEFIAMAEAGTLIPGSLYVAPEEE